MTAYRSLVALGLASLAVAAPTSEGLPKRWLETRGNTLFNVFRRAGEKTSLAYVKDSGICETTEGVTTYSGYLDVNLNSTSENHMWYWFFSARQNASTAPLVLWLNGGPGCSSMIGLFQEHGPCRFPTNDSSEPVLNAHSWNNYANMLYVDQPMGTGFSYGNENASSTVTAAEYVWKFMQNFYVAFPEYESREFGIWTESYGGHYGPQFSVYFQSQNAAIEAGDVKGKKINLVALGIGNGWIDPVVQYKAFPLFVYKNNHKQLIGEELFEKLKVNYTQICRPAFDNCTDTTGNVEGCMAANDICTESIENPIMEGNDFSAYDILQPQSAEETDPPPVYKKYLADDKVLAKIGAQSTYGECPDAPYNAMWYTGDIARSFREPLSRVVQSGVNVLIYAGDRDYTCNWMGNLMAAHRLTYDESDTFRDAEVAEYTMGGKSYGEFKVAGKLNFLRVYNAGHTVPYYQPEIALQFFTQIMKGGKLRAT